MKAQPVLTIVANVPANWLELRYAGHVTAADLAGGVVETKQHLAALKPGFSLVTDLTDLMKMDLACRPFLDEVMDLFRERGVTLVVRVIPDHSKDIGFGILTLFHYDRRVKVVTCASRAEAEKVLPRAGRAGA